MDLRAYQRAVVQASFALEPDAALFEQLGDAPRFRLYRTMIRARLEGMAKVAYRGALAVAGQAPFAASFARFLECAPPTSPLIREVIAAFARFARADQELLSDAPSCLADLFTFEEARWCVAYERVRMPGLGEDGLRELDFEGVPVLNPTLRTLSLAHAVHERGAETCSERRTLLFVYRPPRSDDVRWYAADPLAFELLCRASSAPAPLGELVRAAADQLGRTLDESLLEGLASSLTLALERGVILGSRA